MNFYQPDPEFDIVCRDLPGPVLVAGACGFIGSVLLRKLLQAGVDAYGTVHSSARIWRLDGIPAERMLAADLTNESDLERLVGLRQWGSWFHLAAHGAYPQQRDVYRIFNTNVTMLAALADKLRDKQGFSSFVHAGTSSEYGHVAEGPDEDTVPQPNSSYAMSKVAAAQIISYMANEHRFPGVNLRLYSVYGPFEEPGRLMPTVIECCLEGRHPPYANPTVTRDFVYVDDACMAFVMAACRATELRGRSFNIGSGISTRLDELARISGEVFGIQSQPDFGAYPEREWEVVNWRADPSRARTQIGWRARHSLREGLRKFADWKTLRDEEARSRARQ